MTFRRMGLADKIRTAGLDCEVPMDVYIALAMNIPPLLHLRYPSVTEARDEIAKCVDGTLPLEPSARVTVARWSRSSMS